MTRRPVRTVAIAGLGGLANAAVVAALLVHFDYPLLDSTVDLAVVATMAFLLGAVPFSIAAHTGLVAPAGGLAALLCGTVYVELTTPIPEKVGELGGYDIVEGPFHIYNYADSWLVLLALLLVAGVAEFAIRRGYGLGAARLRNLPALPLPWRTLAKTVAGVAALVGIGTVVLVDESAGLTPETVFVVFVSAAVVTVVPLAALLARGLLAPLVLFALVVPRFLLVEIFLTTDSYVHILVFGPYAIILAIAWKLEALLRSRYRGWNGGRFARRTNAW
ncbi:hypothetical protein [Natrinema salifodinae]|uniref:Uncharacterized protein n=1 Tax=Natrinema salifodinae TaxID=1202768 RepID=A0A1I0Q2G8_9EURY|nr:hypothetical protein [Natrinema salifodinae]SEW21080.1 hypothetical protein SAMN05216285_2977 [Natrinema salifodinae]